MQKNAKGRLPLIISLTTIPSRVNTLHITIRSLLSQDMLPEKIVLWLNEDFKQNPPPKLAKLEGDIFEIRYSPYTFSHRKLIHSLEMYPDKILVTCDDDLIYHPTALRLIYEQHLKTPDVVIGHRCREIYYDDSGAVLPYLQWPFVRKAIKNEKLLMPVGAFLVLYPPNILSAQATDIETFTKISPKSDDLWFKLCTLLNNKLSITSEVPPPEPIPIMGTQKVALKHINNTKDYKRKQWEVITDYFDLEFNQ